MRIVTNLILIPIVAVSLVACSTNRPETAVQTFLKGRPVSKTKSDHTFAAASAVATTCYGRDKAARYMEYYRQGYEQQIQEGSFLPSFIRIELAENGWLERAYSDGSDDARKDMK